MWSKGWVFANQLLYSHLALIIQPPTVTAPFINNGSGLFTNYIDTVTAGDLVTFSITGSDNGFLPTGFPQTGGFTLNYFRATIQLFPPPPPPHPSALLSILTGKLDANM